MIASTFLDLVVGTDIHFEMVPTPAPVPTPFPHPFVGMVWDPEGLVSGLLVSSAIALVTGEPITGPVLINLLPATNTGTEVKNKLVLPHFVIPPGTMWTPMPKAPKPKIGAHETPEPDPPVAPAGDAVLMMGSKTVTLMGSNAVRLGDVAMSCSEPVRLPSSVVMAIPKGPPVLVGGPPAIDWQQAAGALLRSKWVSNHLHGLVSRIKNQRLRNLFHSAVCFLTGHPVDVATGRVLTSATDFELPGPLPLKLERQYASSWSDRNTVLGYGWSHSLDQAIWLERGKVVYRAEDGREIEFDTFGFPDHFMREGDTCDEPLNRLTLRSLGRNRWEIETADGITHEFAPVPGDTRQGHARLISRRTRDGHAHRFEYDARGNLHWVTDSGGRRILFDHDEQGRLVRVALPHPRERAWVTHTRYLYSAEGDLVEVQDALKHAARYTYEGHLLVRETDRTGLSFYFGYDGVGTDAYCVRTWGDGGIYDHELVYDKQNHVTAVTNSLGHTTIYFANAVNAVVKVMDPLGGETKYEYDENLRRTAEIDPLGNTTRNVYDERGNRVESVGADGARICIEYDHRNNPIAMTNEVGGTWRWRYDSTGRVVERQDPLGRRTRYVWQGGLMTALIGAEGNSTTFTYDAQKNLTMVRWEEGVEFRSRYDRLGHVVQETDARGAIRSFRYDAVGRVLEVREPDGNIRQLTWDAEGNLLMGRDHFRHIRFSYSGFHRLASSQEAESRTLLRYDTEGRLIEVENALGEKHRFALDACGRTSEERGFDGRSRRYQRDPRGLPILIERPSGATSRFEHDPAGRIVTVQHSDGTAQRFTYRADGALSEATNEEGTLRFERDILGRLSREQQGDAWVNSRYDQAGRRSGLESSLGAREILLRDKGGSIKELILGTSDSPRRIQYQRDSASTEVAKHLPGGINVRETLNESGYPSVLLVGSQGEPLKEHRYQWAPGGRLVAVMDSAHGWTHYEHDSRGWLTAARSPDGSIEYRAPDEVGNVYRQPNRADRKYASGGALLEAEGTRYRYDADGNLVEKCTSSGERWQYRYDGSGQLKEVIRPDGSTIAFAYDALGRRVSKRSNGSEVRWVWDRDVPLHELNADGDPILWLFEPGCPAPLVKVEGNRFYSVVTNHLGTPTALYDDAGQLAWRAELDTYGRVQTDVALTDCPWRWPGQYSDEETGLYYNRFRYYDPSAGCYTTPDPIGLAGGLNLYRYTRDPICFIDPLGLVEEWEVVRYGSTDHVGDGLDAHELLQSSWLKHNHAGYEGRSTGMGRDNPAMGIKPEIHDRISAEQRRLGLHDEATLLSQTALQNIELNAEILEKEMIASGMSPREARRRVRQMKAEATQYANNNGCR